MGNGMKLYLEFNEKYLEVQTLNEIEQKLNKIAIIKEKQNNPNENDLNNLYD